MPTSSAPIVIAPSERVFVLTGAGISAESGIPTFRDAGGIWESVRFEDVASPQAWEHDPELVWRFYSMRRERAEPCVPNRAHHALTELEQRLGDRFFLCTQNVDALHEAAGTKRVLHMHGELYKTRCSNDDCTMQPFADHRLYTSETEHPRCDDCGSRLRPHIVWFGEVPFSLETIHAKLERADVFVTIGSSGAVYPAAGFVSRIRQRGARAIYVGVDRPDNAAKFDEVRLGCATAVVPSLFAME